MNKLLMGIGFILLMIILSRLHIPVEGFEPDPLNLSISNFVYPSSDDKLRTYEKPCEACECRHSDGWGGRGFQWCCDDSCDSEGELVIDDSKCSGRTTVSGDYPFLGSIRGVEHGDKCTAEEKVTGFTKSYANCQNTSDVNAPCNLWGKNTAWNGYDYVKNKYNSEVYENNDLNDKLKGYQSTIYEMNSQISDLQFKLEQCQSSSPTPSPDIP